MRTRLIALSAKISTFRRELETRSKDLPEGRRVEFRIGVNSGDVIEDWGDIYGDGVNVAARLEALADPGGICISEAVRTAVGKRLSLDYEDMGAQEVKNIEEPVRAFRVVMAIRRNPTTEKLEPDSGLPEKPSIAVLPFTNMSGDVEQEYFSDGITEDIITELSRFRELQVIARHSSFFYKGKAALIRDIGETLNVGDVLEGSVRKAADRGRITAQLIDASSEVHIWADRYDRNVDDVFEVQDEVTRAIVGALAGQVKISSQRRATRSPIRSSVYDYVLRGQAIVSVSEEANGRARGMYESAISLDSACARAHTGIAGALLLDWMSGWGDLQADTLGIALAKAKVALELDDSDLKTRWELGKIHLYRREFEQAEIHLRQALVLNPNDSDVMAVLAMLFTYSGNPRQAIGQLSMARELNPFHPAWYLWFLGFAQYTARDYESAVVTLNETLESGPQFVKPRRHLATCYAQLDDMASAKLEVDQILELDSSFGVDSLISKLPFLHEEDREHYVSALIRSGLPHSKGVLQNK